MSKSNPFRQKLNHPSVKDNHGGGACPEQYEGNLKDGRYYYFRYRSATATLSISETEMEEQEFWDKYSTSSHDPRCNMSMGEAPCSFLASCTYRISHPRSSIDLLSEGLTDSPFDGMFQTQDLRDQIFERLYKELNP